VLADVAAAAGHARQPHVRSDPAAEARAKAIALSDADFPAGWPGDYKWRHKSALQMFAPDAACPGVDVDLSGATITGNWSTSHFDLVGGKLHGGLQNAALVFATPAQAELVLRRWALPWATHCNAKGAHAAGGVVQSVTRFHPDAPGTEAYGFRLSTRTAGQRGYGELIFLRADARLSVFLRFSTRPFDTRLEGRLTRLVAHRMTAGIA
jgi:hypothetical protein